MFVECRKHFSVGLGWCVGNWKESTGFVPPEVKFNLISYQKLILEQVLKDLIEKMFSGEIILFYQGGAHAHTSISIQS